MSKIEKADEYGRATAAPAGPDNLFTYRIRGLARSALVLWSWGPEVAEDRVHTLAEDGRRRMPVFVTARQARAYASRQGWDVYTDGDSPLELVRVQRWLADPVHRRTPPGAVLDAWNFFEDLARGCRTPHALPAQGEVHNHAYEKLFSGEHDAWTAEERAAVLELLSAGVELWESCPVVRNPPTPGPRPRSPQPAAPGASAAPAPHAPAA
ncbi:hypothetical protein ACIPRD_11635 [Streptomyces sp. NPDC090108]|uniref:hypothetical protein n=1 Tax=Streptomyces sp. NPDC090108 TaxID=3365947 RepID=UPI003803CD74